MPGRPVKDKAMLGYPSYKRNLGMADLNLNQLQTFVQVVATGSFSAAADRLGLSQPAVSLQIRQLERRLGLKLLERLGRSLKPTAAGAILLDHAERIQGSVDQALQALASHGETITGRVAIGTGATACIHLLPPLLGQLRQRFPQLDVRVSTGNTLDVLRAVEDNRLDLGLVTLPASGRNLQVEPLLDDAFVALLLPASPLPQRALTPPDLAETPLLAFETGSSTRLLIDDWFRRAGQASRPVMELGSIEALKELVAAGLGYSLVPGIAVATEHHRHGLRVQPLVPPLTRTLALVLRRDKPLSRALQQVLEALRQLRS